MDTRVLDEKRKYTEAVILKINWAGYEVTSLSKHKHSVNQLIATSVKPKDIFTIRLQDGVADIIVNLRKHQSLWEAERMSEHYRIAAAIGKYIQNIDFDKVLEVYKDEIVE